MTEEPKGDPDMFRACQGDEAGLSRVRRVGALGPDTENAREMVDQLASAFAKTGVEVESVSAVPIDQKTILMIEVGDAELHGVIQFLSEMLATGLDQSVVAVIGNRAFTHRLNVALTAAGHDTDLLLPDEIVWIVPESLQETLRELDASFAKRPLGDGAIDEALSQDESGGSEDEAPPSQE